MQGVEHHQQTHWHVWTLLSPVPRLGKLHRLTTLEERGTQWLGGANPPDLDARIRQTCQQESVPLVEGSKASGIQYV